MFNLKFLKPLYYCGVLLGAFPALSFETLKSSNTICVHIYALAACCVYFALYCASLWKRFQDVYPFTPNVTDAILDLGSYTCITITSLVLVVNNCLVYRKDLQRLLKKFQRIDNMLTQTLHITKEPIKMENGHKKWFYLHVTVLGMILLTNVLYTEIFWGITITFESNWGYNAVTLQKVQLFIASMTMYNLALALKHRFAFLNSALQQVNLNVVFDKDAFVIGNNTNKSRFIEELNKIHKQLLLMCIDYNQIFGTPILLLCASFIFSILHPINSALCQVLKGNVFEGVDIPNFGMHYVIMSVLSAFNTIVLVVPLAHACYEVVEESSTAIQCGENLASQLSVFQYDQNVKNMFKDLMSMATERSSKYPIFSACGFYKIDHTMLFTLFGSVTTYLIVLIQINMLGDPQTTKT